MLDPVTNFGKATVSLGYDSDDTSIVLSSGEGAKFPQPSSDGAFNLVWWNATDYGDPADDPNVEIVRVTARSSDTLTVTRAQESTSATNKNTGGKTYQMALALTKKTIDALDNRYALQYDRYSATVFYCGYADVGSATSSAVWRIRRGTDVGGGVVTIEYADGNAEFDNIWDNRASLSYS